MRTVCFVSDRTGITTETLGHSLLSQFATSRFRTITMPFVSSVEEARGVVTRIDAIATEEGERPIVLSTLVDDEVRAVVAQAKGFFLDFFDVCLAPLEAELGVRSAHVRNAQAPGVIVDHAHSERINATNYALANDDGAGERDYRTAQVILLGVSRTGKTPTSLFLALQYGIFAANYPLTEEDLERGRLPEVLMTYRDKLHALTILPDRLQQIRQERRPGSRYASPQQVLYEVRTAMALFDRYEVPWLDVSDISVEEIASRILARKNLSRHVRT